MFWLHSKQPNGTSTSYTARKQISLLGCRKGEIPRLLSPEIPQGQNEPYAWHLEIRKALNRGGREDCTIIIDLKPNRKDAKVSLYELHDVWGYCEEDWTPLLLHLERLADGIDPAQISRQRFDILNCNREGPIYEFLSAYGTVADGRLSGTWSPPPPKLYQRARPVAACSAVLRCLHPSTTPQVLSSEYP